MASRRSAKVSWFSAPSKNSSTVHHSRLRGLAILRAKVARLERLVARELPSELKRLPASYGFTDLDSFLRSVTKAVRTAAAQKQEKPPQQQRRRALITRAMRLAVKSMTKEGRTETEVARSLGISLSSVHNIKKSSGLVRKRS